MPHYNVTLKTKIKIESKIRIVPPQGLFAYIAHEEENGAYKHNTLILF